MTKRRLIAAALVIVSASLVAHTQMPASLGAPMDAAGAAAPETLAKPAPHVIKARPFSASSPWNKPTSAKVKWFNTPLLHRLSDGSFRHWYVNTESVGIWWASAKDPVWTFRLRDFVAPDWHRNRHARTFRMHAPANIVPGTDSDQILVVINQESGKYAELWGGTVNPKTRTVTNRPDQIGWAIGNAITGPGAGTVSNNNGVRASNFSWAAGLITGADLAKGKIDHALVLALSWDMLMGGGYTGKRGGAVSGPRAWRLPATAWDAGWWGGPIKMGSRIGVPAGVAKPAGLSKLGSMVFASLQKYGAFVGDYAGGQWPMFYADRRTVSAARMCPLFCFWDHNGSSDMEKIGPLLRVADYQP